jgi:long-chain acyl-CoA synthetase
MASAMGCASLQCAGRSQRDDRAARRHGDKTFIVEKDDGTDRRLTFEQVFAWRDRLVPLLQHQAGRPGGDLHAQPHRMDRRLLAVIKAGGIAALLNSRGSPAELVAMIEEVTPELVLADSRAPADPRGRLWRAACST